MSFPWRNHPISLLHGSDGPHSPPQFSDWELWVNGTERKCGAVGANYILKMIEDLDWEGVGLPVFLQMPAAGSVAPPSIVSDYKTDAYKLKVIELAISSGKIFKDNADPTNPAKIKSNYTLLETEITSFGSQLFDAAKAHYLTVFTDSTRHGYSLKPLLEWKVIEKLINPKAVTDAGKSWIELSNLVQMEP